MREQEQLFTPSPDQSGPILGGLLQRNDRVFVKKLSTNDRAWSFRPDVHQAGAYIPPPERDSGFFPRLIAKARSASRPGEAEIRECFFATEWPQHGILRESRLVHYTSKGTETHLTRLPKEAFRDLSPASYLVILPAGAGKEPGAYLCLTIDSASEEARLLEEVLSLEPDFLCGVRSPKDTLDQHRVAALSFVEQALAAFKKGKLAEFSVKYATIPPSAELAAMARKRFLDREGLTDLNPFSMERPGDAIRQISRGDEYDIFRDFQIKAKSLELVRMIVGDRAAGASIENVVTALIRDFQKVDALLLSASQQRRSRAGYSFEHHIEAMLVDGGIPFEKQAILEAKKRPDFVLPSLKLLKDKQRDRIEAVVLSAKTTLRERWKQVQREITNCDLFLATVDDSIAVNAIQDMRTLGIFLVVPETLKKSDITEYETQDNVIDFKTFFESEVATKRRPLWTKRRLA